MSDIIADYHRLKKTKQISEMANTGIPADDPAVEFDKDDVGRLANYLHALVVKGLTYQVKDMGDKIFVTLTGGY